MANSIPKLSLVALRKGHWWHMPMAWVLSETREVDSNTFSLRGSFQSVLSRHPGLQQHPHDLLDGTAVMKQGLGICTLLLALLEVETLWEPTESMQSLFSLRADCCKAQELMNGIFCASGQGTFFQQENCCCCCCGYFGSARGCSDSSRSFP